MTHLRGNIVWTMRGAFSFLRCPRESLLFFVMEFIAAFMTTCFIRCRRFMFYFQRAQYSLDVVALHLRCNSMDSLRNMSSVPKISVPITRYYFIDNPFLNLFITQNVFFSKDMNLRNHFTYHNFICQNFNTFCRSTSN